MWPADAPAAASLSSHVLREEENGTQMRLHLQWRRTDEPEAVQLEDSLNNLKLWRWGWLTMNALSPRTEAFWSALASLLIQRPSHRHAGIAPDPSPETRHTPLLTPNFLCLCTRNPEVSLRYLPRLLRGNGISLLYWSSPTGPCVSQRVPGILLPPPPQH